MHTIKPGSIGVMLDDPRIPPRMFELTDEPHRMGIAYFAPLDDPLARVAHRLAEFWPLIDSIP
jgi:hypothetical protein